MLHQRLFIISGLTALTLLIAVGPQAQAGGRREGRRLLEALHEMEKAQGELKAARHDFGGHRDKAVECLGDAIKQTTRALKEVGIAVESVTPDVKIYGKYESYKHLRHALHTIREARTELRELKRFERAADHRDRAVRELNRAEEQVEKALKFAR
jgi:hypothetical protein